MVYKKMTMFEMESINVRVDDYLTSTNSSRKKDPHVGFLHEDGNILIIPKDAPPSSDRERGTISTDVRIVLEGEHLVFEEVRTTKDTQQHQDDQDTFKQTEIPA